MRNVCWLVALAGLVVLYRGCEAPQPRPAAPEKPAADPMTAVHTLIDAPEDFATQRIGSPEFPIPPYAKFLKGVKICLDPGHGGDASKRSFKRGPNGVREAEINLRVAKYLRELLTRCGAEVKLTREDDVDSSLADRANVANTWGADIFLALHHNAIDNKPQVNHTTVWYHKDVDYRPSDIDLARYVCQGLYDSLALPEITDVPLKSDQLMYESGFGVLRAAQVTAALSETSFFTNPDEEQRLRTPEYNLREAYGVFLGLARYAAAGLPKVRLIEPADGVLVRPVGREETDEDGDGAPVQAQAGTVFRLVATHVLASAQESMPAPGAHSGPDQGEADDEGFIPIVFQLDDGLRGRKSWGSERQMIISDSIAVRIDGEDVPFEFVNDGYKLTAELPDDIEPGTYKVEVQFENMNKNSVLNPYFTITVK
jgi:N-acetylmuramoyl-L-alanine amidase